MDQLTQMMRNALSKQAKTSPNQHIVSQDIRFTLDPTNSNRAIGSDNFTIMTLEYGNSIEDNYIKYAIGTLEQYFHFENHHNKSCSIFISKSQKFSSATIRHLRKALIAIGFSGNIEINFI